MISSEPERDRSLPISELPGEDVTVSFGDRELREGILRWLATPVDDPNRWASLEVDPSALFPPIDFASRCVVSERETARRLFTGVVVDARLLDHHVIVSLRTPTQEMSEGTTGGLVLGAGSPVLETLQALVRLAGFGEIHLENTPPLEMRRQPYEITVPVEGLRIDNPLPVGSVTFRRAGAEIASVRTMTSDPSAGSITQQFLEAEVWATAILQANALDDAERQGVEKIQEALAWLQLQARFSHSSTPTGQFRPYERAPAILGRLAMRQIAHVRATTSAHRWLRVLVDPRQTAPVTLASLGAGPLSSVPRATDRQLWLALRAWKRSFDSSQAFERVSALWQAVELYASGVGSGRLFSKAELAAIRDAVPEGLSAEQRTRVKGLIQQLNSPPLMVRVETLVRRDRVPVTPQEWELLKRTRTIRNEIEHGAQPSALEQQDLDLAVGLVGRLLAYRAAHV